MAFLRRWFPVAESTDPVFRILAVCTGNICRSPQAEQLLRVRIPAAFGRADIEALEVSSAGTGARAGDAMDPHAAEEAERLGIADTAHHRARPLTKPLVRAADLVLSLDRQHRDAVDRWAAMPGRSFTLVELSFILEHLAEVGTDPPVEPLGDDGFAAFMRRVVDAAHAARAHVASLKLGPALDIVDPYGRAQDVYRQSADSIDAAVARLASAIPVIAAGARTSS